MQTSGLVVHLMPGPAADEACRAIRLHGGFELGEAPRPDRLPAVLQAPSPAASESAVRWLERLDGVCRVEIAFVHWAESGESLSGAGDAYRS